jgi:O-antigen ligase
MESALERWSATTADAGAFLLRTSFRPVELVLRAPSWLFVGTLLVMLLRAPDLTQCWADRIAFGMLMLVVLLRAVLLRQSLRPAAPVAWAMAALGVLAVIDLLGTPYDVQLWSVAAAKFFVPFALFYLAGLVFDSEESMRLLESLILLVFTYLVFTSIAYVTGLHSLVFPRFILDPNLGTHLERARGPFLQAQANGTAMTLLGLLALDCYRRGRLRGLGAAALLVAYPIALLLTKTRAVWLAFAISSALLAYLTTSARVRRTCIAWLAAAALGLLVLAARPVDSEDSVGNRLNNGSTVQFRLSAYEAGWTMFVERPLLGWGARQMQTELARRIDGFHGDVFVVHNTYFEIVLEHGLAGFLLYGWIWWRLFSLRREGRQPGGNSLLAALRGPLWTLLLAVYLVSATFVVMNYQFVNALIFALAGILAAQNGTRQKEDRELSG